MKPSVSVLTPTWNRAPFLDRVWEGLNSQSFKNFEWIVANDGSEDNTIETVHRLAAKSQFPVTLISASCRIGKARMDNEAVTAAKGDFIIWCDSDDYFYPNALHELVNAWLLLPERDREQFCGVAALCETENGVLGNKMQSSGKYQDIVWDELFVKISADHAILLRTELVKKNPFIEVDFVIPESSVWALISHFQIRFLPLPLKRVVYRQANCISYSGKMSYCRGYAHAMAKNRETSAIKKKKDENTFWRFVNFVRYCRHGEIRAKDALTLWNPRIADYLQAPLAIPVGELLAAKDNLQGKVNRTHRDYLVAREIVSIEKKAIN